LLPNQSSLTYLVISRKKNVRLYW